MEVKLVKKTRRKPKEKARVMEIWIGDSDESDIVRFEDDYGRT